jgi:APA family basic amino acid/polyamine antiporter
MLAFFSAHLSLIVLRIKKPDLKRPFRAPFNIRWGRYSIPLTALIGALATMSVWFLVVITKPEGRYLGFAWMAFGLIMYYQIRKRRRLQPMGHVVIEEVEIPGYQPMHVKKILVPTRGGTQTETVQMACEIAKLHNAEITALHVIEIPASLPLDIGIPHRLALAEAVLKRAEAIAGEIGVTLNLKILRSRSLPETIVDVADKGKYDLIVLGALISSKERRKSGMGPIPVQVLRKATCRVWVCMGEGKLATQGNTLLGAT